MGLQYKRSCRYTLFTSAVSLFFFGVLFLFSTLAGANPKNSGPPGSPEISSAANSAESSTFAFIGLVEPSDTLRILLQPVESVKEVFIKKGDSVVKDQPLVQLENSSYTNAGFDLLQKQNQIFKEKQQIEITTLEVRMKERQLQRINGKMDEESRLASKIDCYISTVRSGLEEQRFLVTLELEILRAKLAKMQQADDESAALQKMISNQLASLNHKIERLLIRAPYPAEVVFLIPDPTRPPPGGVVAELWRNNSYMVRGQVMQHQIEQISIGEQLEVSLEFSQQPALKGTIREIRQSNMAADRRGGYPTFDVLVEITDTSQWIRPGMMVSLKKFAAPGNN